MNENHKLLLVNLKNAIENISHEYYKDNDFAELIDSLDYFDLNKHTVLELNEIINGEEN